MLTKTLQHVEQVHGNSPANTAASMSIIDHLHRARQARTQAMGHWVKRFASGFSRWLGLKVRIRQRLGTGVRLVPRKGAQDHHFMA